MPEPGDEQDERAPLGLLEKLDLGCMLGGAGSVMALTLAFVLVVRCTSN